MRMPNPRVLVAVVMCTVAACGGAADGESDAALQGPPTRVRDTTGAEFTLVAGDPRALQSVDALSTECGDKHLDTFELVTGDTGFALVCALDPSVQRPADYLCRTVACSQASACPTGLSCEQGLCRCTAETCESRPAGEKIHSLELMARCLHDKPRPARCLDAYTDPSWALVSQTLLDHCDSESLCTVPEACR
ncbi:MAG: hypothetical protein ABW321_26935 [Polyangiales bacterium]